MSTVDVTILDETLPAARKHAIEASVVGVLAPIVAASALRLGWLVVATPKRAAVAGAPVGYARHRLAPQPRIAFDHATRHARLAGHNTPMAGGETAEPAVVPDLIGGGSGHAPRSRPVPAQETAEMGDETMDGTRFRSVDPVVGHGGDAAGDRQGSRGRRPRRAARARGGGGQRLPEGAQALRGDVLPGGWRCRNGACVASCDSPVGCGPGGDTGGTCGGRNRCFCTSTPNSRSGCHR